MITGRVIGTDGKAVQGARVEVMEVESEAKVPAQVRDPFQAGGPQNGPRGRQRPRGR